MGKQTDLTNKSGFQLEWNGNGQNINVGVSFVQQWNSRRDVERWTQKIGYMPNHR